MHNDLFTKDGLNQPLYDFHTSADGLFYEIIFSRCYTTMTNVSHWQILYEYELE